MSAVQFVDRLVKNYEKWVIQNSGTLGEMESVVKYLSYIFTSQMENANLLSELFHSLSKLLVFYNDQIIYKASVRSDRSSPYRDSLKRWLTIIGHCEVLIELSAQKVWGTFGRWLIISIIQVFKSIIRLTILFDRKEFIVEPNPISSLNRKNIEAIVEETASFLENDGVNGFILPNGRIIRTIEGASSIENRTWRSLNNPLERNFLEQIRPHNLTGEVIYIIKPLLHLGSIYYCGTKSWKPWMLSLILDIASLRMLTDGTVSKKLNERQRAEVTRRSLIILMYLMKSPFYDKKTKDYVNSALMSMSKLPLLGIFFKSLKEYLPQWQQTYFYLWSS